MICADQGAARNHAGCGLFLSTRRAHNAGDNAQKMFIFQHA
jgi:hypothetical protein